VRFFNVPTALSIVVAYLVLVAATVRVAAVAGPPPRVLGLRRTAAGGSITLVAALLVATGIAAQLLEPVFHGMREQDVRPARFPGGGTAGLALVLTAIAICILGPFAEELFFRGLVMGCLRPLGAWPAVLGSAAVFAAAHLQPAAFPILFCVGAALGLLYERTGSLWPGVAFHVVNNGAALAIVLAS
jgi:membrane protease YdiL (CAAX protease family)